MRGAVNVLVGVLGLVPIWLLGAQLAGLAGFRRADATDLPLELALGTLALAVVGTLVLVSGVRLTLVAGYALVVPVVLIGWVRGVKPRLHAVAVPSDAVARVLWMAALGVLVLIASAALHDRLAWDGFAIWALKARILLVDQGIPADYWLRPGPLEFAHPDYPLALPLLDWWLFAHAREANPALASFAGAAWFTTLVYLLWTSLSVRGRRDRYAAAATLGLAAFWPIWYFAVGGTADVVMALVFLGVALELERAASGGDAQALARAAVYLGLGALTKNEGLAAALVGGVAIGIVARTTLPRRRAVRASLVGALPLVGALAWRAWTARHGADVEQLGGQTGLAHLGGALRTVASEVLRLAVYRQWPPVLVLIALGVWRWRRNGLTQQTAAWALLAAYLVLAMGVYLTTEQDLAWLLETSLGRVVSAVVPAAVFLTIAGLDGGDGAVPTAAPEPHA